MQLNTWAHRTVFNYDGSVATGTTIEYGAGAAVVGKAGYVIDVTAAQYAALLHHFRGRVVSVMPSREPKAGTLSDWLNSNVSQTAIASYVAPILIHEGYAKRVGRNDDEIRFI